MQYRISEVLFAVGAVLCLAFTLLSCGGGSGTNSDPSAIKVAGNWQISMQKTGSSLPPKTQSGFLLQDPQNALTGGMLLTDSPCSGVGNASGSVNGSKVYLAVSPTGISVTLSGTIASGGATMSGDYTILSTGCSGNRSLSQTGTWTGTLVAPFSGSFTGSFVSKTAGTFQLSGQITQGANTGASNAPLTGTLNATDYACFTGANFAGAISGTAVILNFSDSTTGADVGQIWGTVSADGKSLTGTYDTIPVGGKIRPCKGGDQGTVTLNL